MKNDNAVKPSAGVVPGDSIGTSRETPPAKISVTRTEGKGCNVTLHFGFDPEEFGPERTRQVWEAFAGLVAVLLDEGDELADFLTKFEQAAQAKGNS